MSDAEKIPSALDSSMQQVGDAYARAFVALAQKESKIELLMSQLGEFGVVLQKLPKLRMVLESPRVAMDAKYSMLDRALAGRADRLFINFTKLLARRGRFAAYRSIVASAQGLCDVMAGRVRAVVTTASELAADSKASLESRLAKMLGMTVLVSTKVDPAIIGGVVVRVGDTVYDASVANRLTQVKNKAIKNVSDSIRRSFERFATEG